MELPTIVSSPLRSSYGLPPLKCLESYYFSRKINRLRVGGHGVVPKGATVKMVSNGYARKDSYNRYSDKIYKRVDSCLVIPPPKGKKPTAVVEFLGGAFIGAVPEVTYSYLIELLANEGFLIISVPYNVTFDHAQAARQVYERFNSCLDAILRSGLPDAGLSPSNVAGLPLYSVGHSNGALLQVLIGSYFSEKIPKANAIISYNNKSANEAVPYFEQMGPLVRQMMPIVEASPVYSLAQNASDAWKGLLDMAGTMVLANDQEALVSLTNFVDQLPSVMNQVRQGISEFRPTPSENRDYCKNSYNVQQTLLVKFNFDTIDETDLLEETLKPRVESIGGTIEKVTLNGNHITPCIQEPKWQVGYIYTPADAIAQGLKTLSLSETRVLSRTITNWFQGLEDLCKCHRNLAYNPGEKSPIAASILVNACSLEEMLKLPKMGWRERIQPIIACPARTLRRN